MNRSRRVHLSVTVVLFLFCIAFWRMAAHEADLYSDALDGAHCGNHIYVTSEERVQFMNNYQGKEHVHKESAIVTAIAAGLIGVAVI